MPYSIKVDLLGDGVFVELTRGALQLNELSDVNSSTPTDRNALLADGTDWESRPIIALDVSDFDAEVSNNTDVAANTAARHDAATVADTSTIDMSISGQEISGAVIQSGIDHGSISGLADDDHTQYSLAAGTRAFTGVVAGVTPTLGAHLATKDYIDSVVQGIEWQDSVADKDLVTAPGSPTTGDRYIIAGTGGGWSAGTIDDIAEWDGSAWGFITPTEGFAVYVDDEDKQYVYTGAGWVVFGSIINHDNLQNVGTNTHAQIDTHIAANTVDVTVTDTAEIDMTLTGQDIKADIVTGSIDVLKLDAGVQASLVLADAAQPLIRGVNPQTGTTYTILAADAGKIITLDNSSDITVTVPSGLGIGFECDIMQKGAGGVTVVESSTTINNRFGHDDLAGQYSRATLTAYVANIFSFQGDTN